MPRNGDKRRARQRFLLELAYSKPVPVVPRTRLKQALSQPVKPSRWALMTPAQRAAHAVYLRKWRLTWSGLERHRKQARERMRKVRERVRESMLTEIKLLLQDIVKLLQDIQQGVQYLIAWSDTFKR